MQYKHATQFKSVLDILQKNRVSAENRKEELEALTAMLNQLNLCRVNVSRFMTFEAQFYVRMYSLEAKLRNKRRMIMAGYSNVVDLEHDLFYLSAKVQINKIHKKFWFK